jgi:hypothetical protein
MKIFLILGGIIVIVIGTIPLQRKFQEYEVQKGGKIITVLLTKVPVPFGCKDKYFIGFIYENKRYSKQVGCNFAELHKAGDSVQLKHKEGTDIFLFPNENVIKEFVASGMLVLVGAGFIVYGFKKRN